MVTLAVCGGWYFSSRPWGYGEVTLLCLACGALLVPAVTIISRMFLMSHVSFFRTDFVLSAEQGCFGIWVLLMLSILIYPLHGGF